MAFKTFAPGVLTSSDVNTFLMQQAVITCTSTTRPASPVEGMTIYETNTDLYQTWTGSAWTPTAQFITPNYETYTPTWTNLTVGNAPTNVGAYTIIGKTAHVRVRLIFGSTTSIPNTGIISASYPPGATFSGTESLPQLGIASLRDVSTGNAFLGTAAIATAGFALQSQNATLTSVVADSVTSTLPFTWTTDDEIRFSITYGIG